MDTAQHRPTAPTLIPRAHVFRVEGGLVINRMPWPLAEELRRQVDVECSGPGCPDAMEILELMRDDIPRLNEARAAVMGAARGEDHDDEGSPAVFRLCSYLHDMPVPPRLGDHSLRIMTLADNDLFGRLVL
jgi:hypothetical protein